MKSKHGRFNGLRKLKKKKISTGGAGSVLARGKSVMMGTVEKREKN